MTPASAYRNVVPLYASDMYVAFGGTLKDAIGVLPKIFQDAAMLNVCGDGATSSVRESHIAVAFVVGDKGFTENTLVHETVHATYRLMAFHGMGPMNEDTQEAYAYLAGWLSDAIRRSYAKYRKQTQPKET